MTSKKKKWITSSILGVLSIISIVGTIICYRTGETRIRLIGFGLGLLSAFLVLIFIVSVAFGGREEEPTGIKKITLMTGVIDIDSKMDEAKFYMNQKDYFQAEQLLKGIITFDSKNNEALYLLNMIYNYRLDIQGSIKFLEMMLQNDPNDIRALTMLGSSYVVLGDDQALHYLEKALSIDPNHAVALSTIVDYYQLKGDMEKYHHYNQRFMKHAPSELKTRLAESEIALMKGDDAIEELFFKTYNLDMSNASHWLQVGNLALKQQQWEITEECYRRAATIDPDLQGLNELFQVLKQKREESKK